MTATVTWHPRTADCCDRINARAAAENIAAERAQAIADCKRIIDDPRGYDDAQLREVCGFYMTYGNGGDHYLRADAHIFALNKREFIARNCPRPEPEPVISEHAKQLAALVIGGLVAVALAAWGL